MACMLILVWSNTRQSRTSFSKICKTVRWQKVSGLYTFFSAFGTVHQRTKAENHHPSEMSDPKWAIVESNRTYELELEEISTYVVTTFVMKNITENTTKVIAQFFARSSTDLSSTSRKLSSQNSYSEEFVSKPAKALRHPSRRLFTLIPEFSPFSVKSRMKALKIR